MHAAPARVLGAVGAGLLRHHGQAMHRAVYVLFERQITRAPGVRGVGRGASARTCAAISTTACCFALVGSILDLQVICQLVGEFCVVGDVCLDELMNA